MRQPVRVVLADDHDAFVEGLGMVLSAEDDLEVVALAGDGASALQAVDAHRPDVLVIDAQMPGIGMDDLLRLVSQARPATQVLLLAEDGRRLVAGHPGPAGLAGMSRAASGRELADAIRAVAAGHRLRTFVDPVAAFAAAPAPASGQAAAAQPERDGHAELLLRSLSERERQILALLARGYSNRRIAEACYLSLNTVRTHVQNVLVKLGVHSKLEAAAMAVRQGLVTFEDRPAAGDGTG
jgi:DNA-binding NarL/FixJ family response regulator